MDLLTVEQSFRLQAITNEINACNDIDELRKRLVEATRLCMLKDNTFKVLING